MSRDPNDKSRSFSPVSFTTEGVRALEAGNSVKLPIFNILLQLKLDPDSLVFAPLGLQIGEQELVAFVAAQLHCFWLSAVGQENGSYSEEVNNAEIHSIMR